MASQKYWQIKQISKMTSAAKKLIPSDRPDKQLRQGMVYIVTPDVRTQKTFIVINKDK